LYTYYAKVNLASARKKEIDQLLWDLISTGREARRLTDQLEAATNTRDQVIHRAWVEGISARAIAQMTQLSHARIQQIVDESDNRHERALRGVPADPRRQDRERSRRLLSHFEAQQDNVLNGLRERVEMGSTDKQLSRYVAGCRDFGLSWPDIADALTTDERSARERFSWLDEQPTRQRRVG
jgi:hypothetical protein